MKTKLSKIILIMIIALGLGTISSNAAISGNEQSVKSGENVTITINSSEKLGSYKVALTSDGGLTYVSCADANGGQNGNKTIAGSPANGATKLGTFTFKTPTVTTDTKYTVKFSATAMETPDLDPVADSSTSVVITVKAPEPPKQEENTNQGGTTNPPANDNNTSNGSGSSDNNTSTGNGTSNNTGSSGSGSGTTTEKPEQKPVEKPVEKSSNNKLKNLGIRPNDFTGFKANTTKYNVSVPNDVKEVEVYAEAQDSKATISGTGKMQLQVGSNQAKVVCTAEDGTTKTYVINITRKEVEEPVEEKPVEEEPEVVEEPEETEPDEKEEEQLPQVIMGLSKLEAIGKTAEGKDVAIELSPAFDENTQEYVMAVPLSVVDIEINAVAADGDAKIEVMGNKNLVEGENIITVIVKIGENTKVYEIKVNKVAVEESFLSQELIMQLAVIAAVITLVLVAIIAIIIMIAKNSKKEKPAPRRAMSSEEIINGILEREAQQEKDTNKTE